MTNTAGIPVDYVPLAQDTNPYTMTLVHEAIDRLYQLPEMKIIIDEIKRRYANKFR